MRLCKTLLVLGGKHMNYVTVIIPDIEEFEKQFHDFLYNNISVNQLIIHNINIYLQKKEDGVFWMRSDCGGNTVCIMQAMDAILTGSYDRNRSLDICRQQKE